MVSLAAKNLHDAVYEELADRSAVTALVSDRIYRDEARQRSPYPKIVLHRLGTQHWRSMRGHTGVAATLLQIDSLGRTPTSAANTAEQVRLALDGFRGQMGDAPRLQVNSVFLDDEGDDAFDSPDGGERGIFRTRQDYTVWHVVDVPTPSI